MLSGERCSSSDSKSAAGSDNLGRRCDDVLCWWQRNADIKCGSAGRNIPVEYRCNSSSHNGRNSGKL
jgi:hypothetical protein